MQLQKLIDAPPGVAESERADVFQDLCSPELVLDLIFELEEYRENSLEILEEVMDRTTLYAMGGDQQAQVRARQVAYDIRERLK